MLSRQVIATRKWRAKNPDKVREGNKRMYLKRRAFIWKLKGDCCLDCKKKYAPHILDFHHKNPSKKLFTIGQAFAKCFSQRLILAEVKKCIVLCANCHRDREWKKKQKGKYNANI